MVIPDALNQASQELSYNEKAPEDELDGEYLYRDSPFNTVDSSVEQPEDEIEGSPPLNFESDGDSTQLSPDFKSPHETSIGQTQKSSANQAMPENLLPKEDLPLDSQTEEPSLESSTPTSESANHNEAQAFEPKAQRWDNTTCENILGEEAQLNRCYKFAKGQHFGIGGIPGAIRTATLPSAMATKSASPALKPNVQNLKVFVLGLGSPIRGSASRYPKMQVSHDFDVAVAASSIDHSHVMAKAGLPSQNLPPANGYSDGKPNLQMAGHINDPLAHEIREGLLSPKQHLAHEKYADWADAGAHESDISGVNSLSEGNGQKASALDRMYPGDIKSQVAGQRHRSLRRPKHNTHSQSDTKQGLKESPPISRGELSGTEPVYYTDSRNAIDESNGGAHNKAGLLEDTPSGSEQDSYDRSTLKEAGCENDMPVESEVSKESLYTPTSEGMTLRSNYVLWSIKVAAMLLFLHLA